MKILFLDVDGVITHQHYINKDLENIDKEKVELVAEIVKATGAKIVLTSSWKEGYNKQTGEKKWYYRILEATLAEFGLSIYDTTNYIRFEDVGLWRRERPLEIIDWAIDKTIDNYVILDDDDWEYGRFNMGNHWVITSSEFGINSIDVRTAIEILNREV